MPTLRRRTLRTGTDLARCRMCGTTVELGADGCCPLGHPTGSPPPIPVAVGSAEAGPAEASPVEAGPAEAGPAEGSPVEAPPVEGPHAETKPTAARPAEGAPIGEVAPPTTPAASTTPADEDSDAASRLDWLDWDAASSPAAGPSEPAVQPSPAVQPQPAVQPPPAVQPQPAVQPPPVPKLPPPPAAAVPQPPAADWVPETDDDRAALDALLAAHHRRMPSSALDVPIEQLRAPGAPAPRASSPATDVHGQADAHADALALAELLLGAQADEKTEERPRRSHRLAVRIAGAVMLLLLTAAMTAAAVVML